MNWVQLNPSGSIPTERRNLSGVFDFFNRNFFIFGGDHYNTFYNETYFVHFGLGTTDQSDWSSQSVLNISPTVFVNSVASGPVRIRYILPKISKINIKILDAAGREMQNLFSGKTGSLSGHLMWDTKDKNSRTVSSGIYYCLLEIEDTKLSKKFIVAK